MELPSANAAQRFSSHWQGKNRAIDSKKKFMAIKEHVPYKADTIRMRKKDAKHVSPAILKLMVKITSIFGSYKFSKNSIASHFLTFRSLSSQPELVYPPWSWGVEEQMLILSSSLPPGRSRHQVNHRTNHWKTLTFLKFGKTTNRAVKN